MLGAPLTTTIWKAIRDHPHVLADTREEIGFTWGLRNA